jgi:CheY-like chemotaxis protein
MEMKRILYGDDNEQNRNALARALKLRNYQVDSTSDAKEFVARARANPYHALITDLEYSKDGKEGYQVLRAIRELPALKVLFSGVAGFEYEAEALESGADYAVLRKDSSALMKLLDEQLNSGGENGR